MLQIKQNFHLSYIKNGRQTNKNMDNKAMMVHDQWQ